MKFKALTIVTIILLAACGGNSGKKSEKLSGTIKIDGSSTVYPITEAVAEEFGEIEPEVQVTIGISGTGGGFKKFGRGEIDISDASRSIKKGEDSLCKSNNISYIELKVAYDGLAVIANPKNTWVDHLTVAELKKIWEPGAQDKITKWNQIRPEWPNKEIHLYGPGVASGTYDYFTEAIIGKSGSSRGDFTASEDDNVLVQGVSGDEYGLAFFGLAYFEENMDKLKLIPVDGGNGPVLPSIESVSNGTYTPLSRPLFLYINSIAAKRIEVQEFTKFYLDKADSLSEEVGYVPLPESEYKVSKDKLNSFIQGLK